MKVQLISRFSTVRVLIFSLAVFSAGVLSQAHALTVSYDLNGLFWEGGGGTLEDSNGNEIYVSFPEMRYTGKLTFEVPTELEELPEYPGSAQYLGSSSLSIRAFDNYYPQDILLFSIDFVGSFSILVRADSLGESAKASFSSADGPFGLNVYMEFVGISPWDTFAKSLLKLDDAQEGDLVIYSDTPSFTLAADNSIEISPPVLTARVPDSGTSLGMMSLAIAAFFGFTKMIRSRPLL